MQWEKEEIQYKLQSFKHPFTSIFFFLLNHIEIPFNFPFIVLIRKYNMLESIKLKFIYCIILSRIQSDSSNMSVL